MIRFIMAILSLVVFSTGNAQACSACPSEVVGPEVWDLGKWEDYEWVFVARIELVRLEEPVRPGRINTVLIEYAIEEVLKGAPSTDLAISTTRTIPGPANDVTEHVLCGDIVVTPGDRLLVYANPGADVSFGYCSPTQLLESQMGEETGAAEASLERVRQWRDAEQTKE